MFAPVAFCPMEAPIDQISNAEILEFPELTGPGRPKPICTSLQDVSDAVANRHDLSVPRRREMMSALLVLSRTLDRELDAIPANPPGLRALMADIYPAAHGLKPMRWRNIKSLVIQSLRHANVCARPSRARGTLTYDWTCLRATLGEKKFKIGLSRFIHFCSEKGVEPCEVSSVTFEAFQAALLTESLLPHPATLYGRICRLWNKVVESNKEWPIVSAPSTASKRCYAPKIVAYSPSFQADLTAYLSRVGNPDVLADDYARPLRASTLDQRLNQILRIAAALVESGKPIEAGMACPPRDDPVSFIGMTA